MHVAANCPCIGGSARHDFNPGTTNPGRLEENWGSREIELADEEVANMRTMVDLLKPQGDRYDEAAAKNIGN